MVVNTNLGYLGLLFSDEEFTLLLINSDPDIGCGLFYCQVKGILWLSHFCRLPGEVTLKKLHWTPFTARRIHPWIEVPFGTKFLTTISGFGTCFCVPYHVVQPFFSFVSSDLQVSHQDSLVLISCPPAKVHCVVEPYCTDKGFCTVVAELICGAQLLHFFFPEAKRFLGTATFPFLA